MNKYKYDKYIHKLRICEDSDKEIIYLNKLNFYTDNSQKQGKQGKQDGGGFWDFFGFSKSSPKIVNLAGEAITEPTSQIIKAGVEAQKIAGMGVVTNMLTSHTCAAYKQEKGAITQKDIKHFADVYKIKPETIDGCDANAETQCFSQFKSMDHFFHRKKAGLPDINDSKPNIIYTPADCYCTMFESEKESKDLWIKGKNYTMAKLMDKENIPDADNYSTVIFRLAPSHYHRFHMPITGKILSMKKIGKHHYSVQPAIVNSPKPDVYIDNARIILEIEINEKNIVYLAIIGATCVGSIVLSNHKIVNTLKNIHKIKTFTYPNTDKEVVTDKELPNYINFEKDNLVITGTEELGWFQYGGSTLVLLYNKTLFTNVDNGNTILANSKNNTETEIIVGTHLLNTN